MKNVRFVHPTTSVGGEGGDYCTEDILLYTKGFLKPSQRKMTSNIIIDYRRHVTIPENQ